MDSRERAQMNMEQIRQEMDIKMGLLHEKMQERMEILEERQRAEVARIQRMGELVPSVLRARYSSL